MPSFRTAPAPTSRDQIVRTSRGIIQESFWIANTAGSSIPTANAASGTMVGGLVGLRAGDVVTNAIVNVATQGTSLTFAKLGLFDSTGAFIVATSSVSATFNSGTGYKAVALTAPYTVSVDGSYYVVFLQYGSGATGATLQRSSTSASVTVAFGTAPPPGIAVNNLTDITSSANFTPSSNPNVAYWVAVS